MIVIRNFLILICVIFISFDVLSQSLSAKSNEISVDFSDLKKNYSISIPTIRWSVPADSISYLSDGKFIINAEVKSIYGLNSVDLRIKDRQNKKPIKELSLLINQASNNYLLVNQEILLPDGEFEIYLVADNTGGFSSRVYRVAYVKGVTEDKKKN